MCMMLMRTTGRPYDALVEILLGRPLLCPLGLVPSLEQSPKQGRKDIGILYQPPAWGNSQSLG